MYWLLVLLVIVLFLIFFPGISPAGRLAVLMGIFVFIIGLLAYVYIRKWTGFSYVSDDCEKKDKCGPKPQPCTKCNGPPRCPYCAHNPCTCAEVSPGQSNCPMCRGGLSEGPMAGMFGCSDCGRKFRCPGCSL